MAVSVIDLSTLTQAQVDQKEAELLTQIEELNPALELKVGAFRTIVIHPKSILDAATDENIKLIEQSGSLKAIIANPTLQDNDLVDRVLSNFRLVRDPGSLAKGNLTIVLSSLTPVVIVQGTIFTMEGLKFTSDESFAARTTQAAVTGPNDRLLVQIAPGEFAFTISITAVVIGLAGNVPFGSTAVPDSTIPSFARAFAATDFSGGQDAATNTELLSRLDEGLAIRAWSNRVSVKALIRNQTAFNDVGPISIIGFGDAEMLRDQHSIFPGSLGGRSDLYVRSTPLFQTLQVTLTGTLASKIGPLGTWSIGIGRNDIPAYYEVLKTFLTTQDTTGPGFIIATEIRSIDLTGFVYTPDIDLLEEGTYSRYQAATITFDDTVTDATPLSIGATQSYIVVATAMPLILDIQDFLNDREVRPTMGDVLVRAAVPCFTTVTFTVNMLATAPTVDTAQVKTAVANAVNGQGFVGELSASFIDQVLHDTLTGLSSVTGMLIDGRIHRPDETDVALGPSAVSIIIPSDPGEMVTSRTTVFFLEPSDVSVTVVVLP